MTEEKREAYCRQVRRVKGCVEMLYPDFEVRIYDDGPDLAEAIMIEVQMREGVSFGLAVQADTVGSQTNEELLRNMTYAAEQTAARRRGDGQPYMPGVPPVDPAWPATQPLTSPPSDDRRVVVMSDIGRGPEQGHRAFVRFREGQWLDETGGAPLRGFNPTHWRECSALERAILERHPRPLTTSA